MDRQLDALGRHFALHPWMLGRRPSLADFALAGPLCGHLRYDLASSERWMQPRPNLYDWSERLWSGASEASGSWVADDALPATLLPLLTTAMREVTPYLDETASLIRDMSNGLSGHLPRMIGPVTMPYADAMLKRLGVPYTLRMAQRVRDSIDQMPPAASDEARKLVRSIGGAEFPRSPVAAIQAHPRACGAGVAGRRSRCIGPVRRSNLSPLSGSQASHRSH